MNLAFRTNATLTALALLTIAATQSIYTGLAFSGAEVPRQLIWGFEGIVFTLLCAVCGAAMVQAGRHHLGWAAIFAAAILNVVQVGVGLTLFGPFGDYAAANPDAAPLMSGIVAYSFMVYNAAKALIGLAAIVFGAAFIRAGARGGGGKALGAIAALLGATALIANTLSLALGRGFSGELPLAGGSGVLATIALGVLLLALDPREN